MLIIILTIVIVYKYSHIKYKNNKKRTFQVIRAKGDYSSFGSGFRTLKPGDRGSDVLEVQKRFDQLGFYLDEIDGIYGKLMKKSLIKFLKYKDLPLTDKIDENL